MDSKFKKCPFCAEEINIDAIKCKHCGELLKSKEIAQLIACKKCNNLYNNKLPKCPKCGNPKANSILEKEAKPVPFKDDKVLLYGMIFVLIVVTLYVISNWNSK